MTCGVIAPVLKACKTQYRVVLRAAKSIDGSNGNARTELMRQVLLECIAEEKITMETFALLAPKILFHLTLEKLSWSFSELAWPSDPFGGNVNFKV
jgi:hypothetical protein